MIKIEPESGKRYIYRGHPVCLRRVLDLHMVLGEYEATHALVSIPVADLRPIGEQDEPAPLRDDILSIPGEAWAKAQRKFNIIQPVLAARGELAVVTDVCRANQIGKSTLYRWLKAYDETGSVRSLVELPRTGGKGKNRLDEARTALIDEIINTHYLTRQKKSASEVVLEIRWQCRQAGLPAPAGSTVRRRIHQLDEEEVVRRRRGSKAARERYRPQQGNFPDADYPLQVVELDHTVVDIILVDEVYRQPIGRPYLTMAIDVYSRMVVGIYLSYDPPGALGTGVCMTHMLLPKEVWLDKIGVEGDWPCWGKPGVLHLDNAREFVGEMMLRACEKYDIRLEYRPVATPHYGGHIERLMGICMKQVHTLPGSTFSNPRERGEYDAEKMAALTLREFEQWLTVFIVNKYHRQVHGTTKQIPYERFRDGILGTPEQLGTGLPERFFDERQVRLDFLPPIQRSVQQYGVQIDHVHYYADVLRSYVNRLEPGGGKHRGKQQFVFKRDPRDISVLYFLEPGTGVYHRIPYRNTSWPKTSIWEHRAAIRHLRQQGKEKFNEDDIFATQAQLRALELAAVERTKQMTKSARRVLDGLSLDALAARVQGVPLSIVSPAPTSDEATELTAPLPTNSLQPFDDLEFYDL